MADVSRSVYLSRKFSNVNEDSSKHVYDGIFSAPAATKQNASSFAARIEEYREIFPPSNASLGSTIPILDLPASDRSVGLGRGVSSDFDYAGVFGGLGDNDGIEVATEKFFSDSNKSVKRDAHPPRIPVPTRRMPSKSQEFSFRHGNDQTSSPEKPRRIPSKSQEFSCNYGNGQTLNPAHRRVPSRSQEFVINHGNDQTSSSAQARRVPSKSQEFVINHGNDQTSSSAQGRRVPSKSQEFVINHGNDQTSSSAQVRRMPSPSQEVSSNYVNDQISSPGKTKRQESSVDPGNEQTSIPAQTRRIPSKSQEFSSNYGNNEASTPAQPRRIPSKSQEFQIPIPSHSKKQYSQSQEFPCNFSTNQTSASALPHETVDKVKHVSFSYNKTNQLEGNPSGTTHIAHLHAVPGYTHVFDESGPVKKPSIDKPKRLSLDDADFGKVSKQGKHLRAVSDLGTNQQAMELDKEVNRSMSMSNSPQSFGSSGYFKRSSRRRSKNNQENIAYVDPFVLLEDELDVNSTAAVSAAAMKKAIEEAEMKIRWAKDFLKNLEGNGFIKPTLKDSFKVNVEVNAFGLKQNVSMKVKPMKQKKYFNEEKVLKQNSYLNSEASVGDSHVNKAVEVKATVGLSAGVDTYVRSPATEKCEEMNVNVNVNDELKFDEKKCKDESGGEWEAAKQLSQLFTGVKNRFVSFMSKQAETEKTVVQKDVQSKSESLEQSRETPDEVETNLDHTVEMIAHDVEICERKDHEVSTSAKDCAKDGVVSESEEEVECVEAHDVKQDIVTEVKGEALQEVEEQKEEMLDVKLEMQNENQMDTTVPVERDELEVNVCQSQEQDNEMRDREDNEEIVDVVPDLEPCEKGFDESLNKEGLTELEMPKEAELKQDVRMVEENCMVEECSGRNVEEEEDAYGGKEDTEKITEQDVRIEAAECLTEVVDDETDELLLSKNQEADQNVEGIKLISEEYKEDVEHPQYVERASELNESVCEQTSCSIDVVDEDSEHEEYLPAVDDILEQDEAAIDEDLPSQKERLTEATSATFEHEGNTERLTSVEMADQSNEECISDDSVSHTEGADESLEHTSDDLCEKDGPEEHQYAQEDKVYVENDLIGEIKETSMSSEDISDLDDTEKETKEADDVTPSIDAEITELDSVLKYEQKFSDEDDESEEANEAANEQDASSQNTEQSHKRRRWFVSTDEVTSFQQPGIFQGTINMDQENVAKDRDEQADGDSDQDRRTEGSQSTEGGSHRRRRWFENSTEKVEVKHDVSSESVERKDVVDDKAGHRRRRWFENSQKQDVSDTTTTKQEANETSSSSEESANAAQQESEEQSKARERQAVERAIREARQRAFAEAKERANAVKAAAAASASVKPLSDKASIDAKLRAERAAVERATAEARERALQKSMSDKVIYKSRDKVEFKNLNSGPSSSGHSTSVPFTSDRPSGAMTESPQRRKAISERNKRTTERAAKALEEKNMRDVLAQKEQAERNRFAGILDAEVKRWSTGKEGNLRSLLSTLQYVLGPDSGWQPIPLTDLVTTTAVRKAYKRAALCVHPDKLQQRRATIQHKYICEKVFDLLKDAWHKFNPDER